MPSGWEPGLEWRPLWLQGWAVHGDFRLSFWGSLRAFDSTVVIRGQTGRCPELDWVCFQFCDLPSTPLGPVNQTCSPALQSGSVPCPVVGAQKILASSF